MTTDTYTDNQKQAYWGVIKEYYPTIFDLLEAEGNIEDIPIIDHTLIIDYLESELYLEVDRPTTLALLEKDLYTLNTLEPENLIDAYNQLGEGEEDITIQGQSDDIRIIKADCIDNIMTDELANDEYILGCMRSWFLSEVTGVDIEVFEAMQGAEAYEAIGKLIIDMGKLGAYQKEAVRYDGYGPHFSPIDGEENGITINGNDYYTFRV